MRDRIEKQNIGQNLARFSLYIPFVVFAIGFCFSSMLQKERDTAVVIGFFNLALIALGFLAGIIALFQMIRFGRTGILYRAIAGIIFNGLVLASIVALFRPMALAAQMRDDLVGNWTVVRTPDMATVGARFELGKDGGFRMSVSPDDANSPVLSGKWNFARGHFLGVEVLAVENGNSEMVGKKIGLGTVRSVSKTQMILQTDNGEELFERR